MTIGITYPAQCGIGPIELDLYCHRLVVLNGLGIIIEILQICRSRGDSEAETMRTNIEMDDIIRANGARGNANVLHW